MSAPITYRISKSPENVGWGLALTIDTIKISHKVDNFVFLEYTKFEIKIGGNLYGKLYLLHKHRKTPQHND